MTTAKIPVLLLKTKSEPADGYEELFSVVENERYDPVFVPVLEHRFKKPALDQVQHDITNRGFLPGHGDTSAKYGAIIFTSQRAVEAFTRIIQDIREEGAHSVDELFPRDLPLYVVGPATGRGLQALNLQLPILGEESGNGEVLSKYILEHYNTLHKGPSKPDILFLVGEKRRDIIPRTLQSSDLPPERRSVVEELVIYETGEMHSFKNSFSSIWRKNFQNGAAYQWIVVFSPTGCKAMLESLGLLDEKSGILKVNGSSNSKTVCIATIGPTTRDYLINEFGFSPNACAQTPSPEGNKSGEQAAAGTKRKEHATSAEPKHEPKAAKKQTTIEESMGGDVEQDKNGDTEMSEAPHGEAEKPATEAQPEEEESTSKEGPSAAIKNDGATEQESKDKDDSGADAGDTIEESSQREKNLASNILEKGIIYFLARNRVGVEDADSVGDLQRTYFVLRPLPTGAKLGDGAIPDLENNRLFALPKKVLPKSHTDRFMAFVEKANTTIQDLKENFFQGSEYETKTVGTRKNEAATVVGEGVYAITRTEDRSTHLAYAITIPTELGEVQDDLGLRSQGSFVISVKNPERPGPASARLPQAPEFPKEVVEEFRGLAWAEVKPKYLDYANCQILLIGEHTDKAVEPTTKDKKHDKETPKQELEQLEHEDELRVEHLNGNDTVFDDLNLSKKEYASVPTTW
ncbi:tetrapyrrole biosynthesis, uroporphyrinogen III synthase [Lophiostoma macrostomum CBS 122681]|uniref:Tetrapyrrole biosynthesis, uroporphyrinogen III synthase n=1 Tax=Lophiostoma macrostomum CBS 122681 TaxID=1314788 RepID=A0A6A6TLL9_9PLEO|nr:tetrapyrrole biosynthesis, uroporphyrinogen III synthase [Lophiostoma macrostomum CBS 122681]